MTYIGTTYSYSALVVCFAVIVQLPTIEEKEKQEAFLNFYGSPPTQAAQTPHFGIHYGVRKSLLITMYVSK